MPVFIHSSDGDEEGVARGDAQSLRPDEAVTVIIADIHTLVIEVFGHRARGDDEADVFAVSVCSLEADPHAVDCIAYGIEIRRGDGSVSEASSAGRDDFRDAGGIVGGDELRQVEWSMLMSGQEALAVVWNVGRSGARRREQAPAVVRRRRRALMGLHHTDSSKAVVDERDMVACAAGAVLAQLDL